MTIEQVGPMSTNPADAVEPGVSEQVFEMVTAGGPVVAVLAAM